MNCIECNAELSERHRFCQVCGSIQKDVKKVIHKKIIIVVSLLLIISVVSFVIISNITKTCQDGTVNTLLGKDYYIPESIVQYGIDGSELFSFKISTDEQDKNYYLKLFAEELYKCFNYKIENNGNKQLYKKEKGKVFLYNNTYVFNEDYYLIEIKNRSYVPGNGYKTTSNKCKYDNKNRIITKFNINQELKYDEKDRLISDQVGIRKYKDNNDFVFYKNVFDKKINKGNEIKLDEYNHVISGPDYSCEYEYDNNGCITSYKFVDSDGHTTLRKVKYQKVSQEDYFYYMNICSQSYYSYLEKFIMPVDVIHSSNLISIDPKYMLNGRNYGGANNSIAQNGW